MDEKLNLNEWFKHNILLGGNSVIDVNGKVISTLFTPPTNDSIINTKVDNITRMKTQVLNIINEAMEDESKKAEVFIFLKKLDTLVKDYSFLNVTEANKSKINKIYDEKIEDYKQDIQTIDTDYGKIITETPRIEHIKSNISNEDIRHIPGSYKSKIQTKDILGQNVFDLMFSPNRAKNIKIDDTMELLKNKGDSLQSINLENVIMALSNLDMTDINRIYNSDVDEFAKIRRKFANRARELQDGYIKEVVKLHSHKIGMIGQYGLNSVYLGRENIPMAIFSDLCRYGVKGAILGNLMSLGKGLILWDLTDPMKFAKWGERVYEKVSTPKTLGRHKYNMDNKFFNQNMNLNEWDEYFSNVELGYVETTVNRLNLAKVNNFDTFTKYRIVSKKQYKDLISKITKSNNPDYAKMFEKRDDLFDKHIRSNKSFKRLLLEIKGENNLKNFKNVLASEQYVVPLIKEYISNKTKNDIVFIPMLDKQSEFYGMYIPINVTSDEISISDLKNIYENLYDEKELNQFVKDSQNNLKDNKYYKNYHHNTISKGSIPIIYANNKTFNIGNNTTIPYMDYKDMISNRVQEISYKLGYDTSSNNLSLDLDMLMLNVENNKVISPNLEFNDNILKNSYIYLKENITNSTMNIEKKQELLSKLDDIMIKDYINEKNPIVDPLENVDDFDKYINENLNLKVEDDEILEDGNSPILINIDGETIELTVNEIEILDNIKEDIIKNRETGEDKLNALQPYLNDDTLNIPNIVQYLELEDKSGAFNVNNLKSNTLFPEINPMQLEFLQSPVFIDILNSEFERGVVPTYDYLDNFLNFSTYIDNTKYFENFINVKYEMYKLINTDEETIENDYISDRDKSIQNVLNEFKTRLKGLQLLNTDNTRVVENIKIDALTKLVEISPFTTLEDKRTFINIGQQVLDNMTNSYMNYTNSIKTNEKILNENFLTIQNREYKPIDPIYDEMSVDDTDTVKKILSLYLDDVDDIKLSRVKIKEVEDWKFEYSISITRTTGKIEKLIGVFDIYPKHDKPLSMIEIDDMNKMRSYILKYDSLKADTKEFLLGKLIGHFKDNNKNIINNYDEMLGLKSDVNKSLKLEPNSNSMDVIRYLNSKVNMTNSYEITNLFKLIGYDKKQLNKLVLNIVKEKGLTLNKSNIDKVFNEVMKELKNPLSDDIKKSINNTIDKLNIENGKIKSIPVEVSTILKELVSKHLQSVFKTLNIQSKEKELLQMIDKTTLKLEDKNTKNIKGFVSKLKNSDKLDVSKKTLGDYKTESRLQGFIKNLKKYISKNILMESTNNLTKDKTLKKYKVENPNVKNRDYEKEMLKSLSDIEKLTMDVNIMRNLEIEKTKSIQRNSYDNIINQQLEIKTEAEELKNEKIIREHLIEEQETEKEEIENINKYLKNNRNSDRELNDLINDRNRRNINETLEDVLDMQKSNKHEENILEDAVSNFM